VEPDSSLDPDDSDDQGLEFVSPPLPIEELLSDLNKVKAWADRLAVIPMTQLACTSMYQCLAGQVTSINWTM
jgi:hypothetical protein